MRDVPAWLLNRPIAHRGLHESAAGRPENSLAAFQAAVDADYPVELDVRLSRDGEVMVFHDEQLDRLTELNGTFAEHEAAELMATRLRDSDQSVPTLAQVLQVIDRRVGIAVEVKSFYGDVGPCEEKTLSAMRAYGGDWIVQSFNPFSLAWFAKYGPEVIRGQLSGPLEHWDLPWSRWRCRESRRFRMQWLSRPDFLCHACGSLPDLDTDRLKARGYPLTSYTVRDQATCNRLAGYVDNFIFEGFTPS